MAEMTINAGVKSTGNMYKAILDSLNDSALSSISGAESLDSFQKEMQTVLGGENFALASQLSAGLKDSNWGSFKAAMNRDQMPAGLSEQMKDAFDTLNSVTGQEGFSMQNWAGSQLDVKATNMTLNAKTHRQTKAAEALYSTVSVKYEDEAITLKVRAAGLGTYAYGNSAYQSASELRPVFGLLRTGEMFKNDVLAIYPVYPEDPQDETRELFVDEALFAPTEIDYMEGDGFGRSSHQTQMLKVPATIHNYLGLCQVPGQRAWTSTDEVESNSIQVNKVLAVGTLDGDDISFVIDTSSMSNRSFTMTINGQSSDDRKAELSLRNFPGFSVQDKDGDAVGETLFADFKTAGYEPMLNISFTGNFQRQHQELTLQAGNVTINGLRNIATGAIVQRYNATAPQKALIAQLTAQINGVEISANVSNTSRGNFGYRVEVFDAIKKLPVRRRDPISVKYPIDKNDVNNESLNFAIDQMAVIINNQTSKYAFDMAEAHLDYIERIDGTGVVGNQQGSNVLPGQHFVTPTAVRRSLTLKNEVSSQDNIDVFDNVTNLICNEVGDIIAALNTRSGLASICEYSDIPTPKWTIVTHSNLARFLMRKGEIRAFGQDQEVEVVSTNFDSEFGRILIVPQNTSSSENINPLGGIGICVSKENVVVQGNVTRDQQDFGLLMTMPSFQHHSLNVIIGELVIEDADEFLEGGILSKLASQRIRQ